MKHNFYSVITSDYPQKEGVIERKHTQRVGNYLKYGRADTNEFLAKSAEMPALMVWPGNLLPPSTTVTATNTQVTYTTWLTFEMDDNA